MLYANICADLSKKLRFVTFLLREDSGKVGKYLHFGCEKCTSEKKMRFQSSIKNRFPIKVTKCRKSHLSSSFN